MINNLFKRVLFSIPLLLLILPLLIFGKTYLFLITSLLFLSLFYEWNYIFFKKNNLNLLIILLLCILTMFLFFFSQLLSIILSFIIIIYISIINFKYKFPYLYTFIIFYFFISFYSAFYLIINIKNIYIIIYIVFIVISFDTLSYIFGNLIKGVKALPSISPNKTLSGYIFGFVCTFIISFYINLNTINFENTFFYLITLLIIFSAIIGDILESIIKRQLSLKDISNFLPGHGGFFDRFDSLLFVFITVNTAFIFLY